MKNKIVLIVFGLILSCQNLTAQVFTVDTLIYNGDPTNRINLLIMGDGYTAAQMGQFRTNAITTANYLLNTPPFNEYKNFFNVFAIEVISAESNIDHSGVSSDNGCGTQPVTTSNNYLQSAFDGGGSGGGVHRCIYSNQLNLIYDIANTNFPQYDYINVLANTPHYGGCAGGITFTSINSSSNEVFVHEFGHSFGGLSDEYSYGSSNCSVGTTQRVNVSQQTDTSLLVWKRWLTNAPIPTQNGTNCTKIGLYPGAAYCETNWYRPKCNCKMKELGQPFCEVCKEQLVYKVSEMVNYIEDYTPQNLTPIICRNTTQLFSINLLNNLNNTIRAQWFVDNNLVLNNNLNFTFNPNLYTNGVHQIKVITYDTTAIARKALIPHELTWNVNVSPLLSLTTSKTNVSCNSGNNGIATVIPTGGISPYTYLWSNDSTTSTINNLTAGDYTVTVTSDPGLNTITTPSCLPITTGYCCNMGIFNVSFNTINNTSGNASEGYKNFDTIKTTVDTGQTYLLSVKTGDGYTENVKAWIDYNNNGIFENTEEVLSSTNTLPNRIHTANVTIPSNTSYGLLIMRIGSDWSSLQYLQPCRNVTYGQFEDYAIYIRGAKGCSQTTSITITQPDTLHAIITANNPTVFCQGDSVKLTANTSQSYLWNTGATTQNIWIHTAGNYSVTITDTSGCTAISPITQIIVNPLPSVTITPNHSTILCPGDSVLLTSNLANAYLWNTGDTTPSISTSTSGNYIVTITDGNGCSSTSSPTVTTIETPPLAAIIANNPVAFCQGDSVILSASGNGSYLWSTGEITPTITVRNSNTYSLIVSNICGVDTTEILVVVNPLPTASITASSSTTFCLGDSLTLTANPSTSYLWNNGKTTQSIVVKSSGNYSVITSNEFDCFATSPATIITVNNLPVASISVSGSTTFCEGNSVTLSANNASSYLWSNSVTSQNNTITTSGNYTVKTTDTNGCSAVSAPINVVVNTLPTAYITASSSTTFCQGDSVILTANTSTSYLWNNGKTTQSIVVKSSGNYSVTTTNEFSCFKTSPIISVTVNNLPNASISANGSTTFCQGNSVTLSANNANSYLWSNSVTSQNNTITTSGNYTVKTTDANGCYAVSAPINVVVNPLPTASITASSSTTFCQGDSITLTANTSTSYLWNNGKTTQSIVVKSSGNYSVTTSNEFDCFATSLATIITVNNLPVASISVSGSTTFCEGNSVTLSANNASSYLWSNSVTSQNNTITTSGNYTVKTTDANGCSAVSAPINVVVNIPQNGLEIIADNDTLKSPYQNNQWYLVGNVNVLGTETLHICEQIGNYYVIGDDENGCSVSSDTLFVNCSLVSAISTNNISNNNVQLFPNPTSGNITVLYNLKKQEEVSIKLYDAIGNIVQYVFEKKIQSGDNSTIINTSKLSNGIYFINVLIGNTTISKKMILMK